MHVHSALRRISALTLVATLLLLIGMPRPTSAAGEEDVAGARHRGLTINGRPLSEFLGSGAAVPGRTLLADLLEQGSGQLTGVVVDLQGQPVADERVKLRSPLTSLNLRNYVATLTFTEQADGEISGLARQDDGQALVNRDVQLRNMSAEGKGGVVGRTTTDATGQFSFTGLRAGNFEVVLDGRLHSRLLTLRPGAMAMSGITFTQATPERRDPIWNGLLIGAGLGVAFGLGGEPLFCFDSAGHCQADRAVGVLFLTAIGAGIGTLVDWAR